MLGLALAAALSNGVPFTLQDHRIFVRAYIGKAGPFAMIVDTGSGGLCITPEVARRLGLHLKPAGSLTGAGAGSQTAMKTTIGGLRVGNVAFASAPAFVIDFSRIRRGIGLTRFDGVIGVDQLRRYRVVVDMDERRISFADAIVAMPDGATQTPFSSADGFLDVPASVDGVRGTFIVDTGDRSQLTLFRGFSETNDFPHFATVRNALTGYGVGGPVYADLLRTTLQAFGTTSADITTRIPLAYTGGFGSTKQAGSIGNGYLERFNVVYDFPQQRMVTWPMRSAVADTSTFRLPPVPQSPRGPLARHALFGAAAVQKPGGVALSVVTPNGPAYAAGLRPGDIVRSMSGRSIPAPVDFYRVVHDSAAGTTLDVVYVRDGSPQHTNVVLGTANNEAFDGVTTTYDRIVVDNSLRRAILTVPSGARTPVPAVLILGGIGCFSVDVATNAQDAYLHLSRDLARAGVATVRIEKSGVGDSQGPPCSQCRLRLRSARLRGGAGLDAQQPVDRPQAHLLVWAQHRERHPPRLARDGGVAGLIVAEAVGRDWPEYEIRNLRRDLELDGSSPAEIDAALIEKASCMQMYMVQGQPERAVEATMPSCKTHDSVYPVSQGYISEVAQLNVIEPWMKLGLPVLAIYGTSDFETEIADHQRIVDVVNTGRTGSATLVTIDGMSHFLGKAATTAVAYADYGKRVEEYDSRLSDAVVGWLRERAGLATP
ncbi:MAG TPA: aspartyl protease family protein [Candidatus Tumulicola sp.]|jgi:hypothetical protein